jgi:hypothetical protein
LNLDRKPVADNELCAACRLVHKCANAYTDSGKTNLSVEDRDTILAKPLDEQFFTKYIGIKGKVLQHELACSTAEDYNRVLSVAQAFADRYGDCLLNPEISKFAKEGRRIARSTHTIISFGMSMASSENTRDQWNNPLVSGSATSQAAFSGFQYVAPTLQR